LWLAKLRKKILSCTPCVFFDLLFLLKFVLAQVCVNPSCDSSE
jgi:hypothetical protein